MSIEGEQLLQKLMREAAEREAVVRALFEGEPERELYSRRSTRLTVLSQNLVPNTARER
jgi:hypothetical protein